MFHARSATRLHRARRAAGSTRGRTVPTVSTPSVASFASVAIVAPAAPAAPAAHTATTALATIAVMAIGVLAFSARAAGGAALNENKVPNLTLTGTTVALDGRTPVPRARITVMPESTVIFTDTDGDFLVPWNGREGWITVIPEERARDGSEWCKRVVLRGQPPDLKDPIVDVGLITVMPKAQLGYKQMPISPPAYPPPDSLRVPGPRQGEPDTCRVQVAYATDLWGRITRVEISGGDQPPSGLKEAILAWIRSVPWTVAAETPCDTTEPFKTRDWMDYAWADSVWVQIPGLRLQDRLKPPGRAPGSR